MEKTSVRMAAPKRPASKRIIELNNLDGADDVRTYLNRIRYCHAYERRLSERLTHYRELALRANRGKGAMEDHVLDVVDTMKELQLLIRTNLVRIRMAERIIEYLPNEKHRYILRMRYLNGEKWEEIAEQMHFTPRWVHKLHKEAIALLDDMVE